MFVETVEAHTGTDKGCWSVVAVWMWVVHGLNGRACGSKDGGRNILSQSLIGSQINSNMVFEVHSLSLIGCQHSESLIGSQINKHGLRYILKYQQTLFEVHSESLQCQINQNGFRYITRISVGLRFTQLAAFLGP